MIKLNRLDGQTENVEIEYEIIEEKEFMLRKSSIDRSSAVTLIEYDKPDKIDYIVAACSGFLTGMLDSIWVGEFSIDNAQDWGRSKINNFVIKVAQTSGYKNDELEGAIRFLEKKAPMASDAMTSVWGGGLQHHFRDFSHHASVVGLVFSVLTQFTEKSYGTNTEGLFEIHELSNKLLIGKTVEEKLFNGIVLWALHLVSDMAGSSSNAGKGTGIPGPMLSMLKELSVLPGIRNLQVNYKDGDVPLSVMLSKIFNGTAFEYTNSNDLKRIDLRTEIGIYAFGIKQSFPVLVNQCTIRALYFVRRICLEINSKGIKDIADIKLLNPRHFLPWNNKCILRMATISSGVFCAVDTSDAAIRAFISGVDNKRELAAQLLLRTNFAGIGNFVISLRNDISANAFGNNLKATIIEKKTESYSSALTNIEIDVSVNVDNTGIYEYAFYRMYEHVRKTKEDFSAALQVDRGMQKAILKLEDDETSLFDTVAKMSYHSLIVETEALVMRLFTFYGVAYVPFRDDSKYNYYAPFYRMEDGKKIAYVFSKRVISEIRWKELKERHNVDGIKLIALVELGEDGATRDSILEYEKKNTGGLIEFLTLKDLFALISNHEYEIYKSYVDKYNENIKKLIGYRTIIVPSESSINEMKQNIESELRKKNFNEILRNDGIHDVQIRIINKNFWDRDLYRAILGSSCFAESFISSEWYYQTHKASTALEQTAIIAGYLKSVEQLLYAIIQLSAGSGKKIKRRGGGKSEYIEFNQNNIADADTTLGAIIGYVRHYPDLWDVNSYVKNYVAEKLSTYREKYRNDHFHKDNINSIEEIEEIRINTLLLYFLLLGAMNIEDSQKERIGILPVKIISEEKRGLHYEDLEQWLNRILDGDVLLSSDSIIHFGITVWGKEQWKMEFSTVTGFNDKGFSENMEWPYIDDDLKWNKSDAEEDKLEAERQATILLQRYLKEGKYSANLKIYKSVSVGWFGRHKELYNRNKQQCF